MAEHRDRSPGRTGRRVAGASAAAVALALALLTLVVLPGAPAGAAPAGTLTRGPQIPVNPDVDPDRSRDRAEDILAGDEYQEPVEGDRTVPERVRRWIADRIPDVDLDGGGDTSPPVRVLSWLLVAVLLIGTVVVVVRVLAHTRGGRTITEEADAEVEVVPLRSSREWEDEAARCRAAGDHRGEVRAWFRATTTTLEDRGLVPATPGRTARELERDLGGRAAGAAPLFGELGGLFEAVWYGGRDAGPDDGARAAELSGRTLAAAPRRSRGSTPNDAADDDRPPTAVTTASGDRT